MSKKRTYREEIGQLISRLRLERGMTQIELAELAGTSQSAIHRIEKGNRSEEHTSELQSRE